METRLTAEPAVSGDPEAADAIAGLLNEKKTPAEARAMNPLTLAYIGDAVFSLYVRRYLVARGMARVDHLTLKANAYVNATAQARMIRDLAPILTPEEADLVRRGRNTKSKPTKNADKTDYRYATGLEALFGYLAMTGSTARCEALLARGLQALEAEDAR